MFLVVYPPFGFLVLFDYNISLNNENVNIKIENNKNKIAMSDNNEIQIKKIDFINGNKTLKQECRGYY